MRRQRKGQPTRGCPWLAEEVKARLGLLGAHREMSVLDMGSTSQGGSGAAVLGWREKCGAGRGGVLLCAARERLLVCSGVHRQKGSTVRAVGVGATRRRRRGGGAFRPGLEEIVRLGVRQ